MSIQGVQSGRKSFGAPDARLSCAFLMLLLAAAACSKSTSPTAKAPRAAAAPVTVAVVRVTNVPLQLESIGHVSASSVVAVRSRVDGVLDSIHVKEGQAIKAGDLIVTIDPRPFEAILSQAKANQAKDEALLRNAEIEERRNRELLNSKILSREVYDQSRAAADALRATVTADKAAVETTQLQLSYCYIRSPINGRTSLVQVYPGNTVKNQDTVLMTLTQTRPIYVDFSVPEKNLADVREHQGEGAPLAVSATLPGKPAGPPALGQLQVINNTVDTNTGTILLRSIFANDDERLWPGQFVNAALTLTTLTNVDVVPAQAVQASQQGDGVFVVKPDSTVEFRPITVRTRTGETLVVSKGVAEGERVVTTGQVRLAPGAKVAVTTPEAGMNRAVAAASKGTPNRAARAGSDKGAGGTASEDAKGGSSL